MGSLSGSVGFREGALIGVLEARLVSGNIGVGINTSSKPWSLYVH